jgi:type II secretory pathway predicted ATPase ExeA
MKGTVPFAMNFLDFFYLKESPFGETPDTRFYFASRPHEEVLRHLFWAIDSHKGFTLVVGDAGSGKTMISRLLYDRLKEEADFAFVLNPRLKEGELLGVICREFGIQEVGVEALAKRLLERAEQGRRNILVVDEAQSLPDSSLEYIRLLTNLEVENRRLLQVIFFAQPEVEARLEQPHLRQLRQRIVLQVKLTFLDEASTEAYIRHRVNKVCELGLRCAAFRQTRLVTGDLINEMPLENIGLRRRRRFSFLAGGVSG